MPTILIIEDDQTLQELYKEHFEEVGLIVQQIFNGDEAMQTLKKGNWSDLIILDLMLPGISGYELLAYIQHSDNKVPVVVISAIAEEQDEIGAIIPGQVTYIAKAGTTLNKIVLKIKEYFNALPPETFQPVLPQNLEAQEGEEDTRPGNTFL